VTDTSETERQSREIENLRASSGPGLLTEELATA